ncbi:MAG: phytanoyl-CoA dioxygenase family protein [Acidimicrobiales bacterium]
MEFVNPSEEERLHRDGYLVVPDVLDAAMVDRLNLAFAASPARPGTTQHVEIDERTPHHDCWAQLARHPVVSSVAQLLMGASVEFRAHGRNPMPGHGQQGLHADALPRQPDEPVRAVTAIWMLDDFSARNGATRVVPGTHLLRHAVPRRYAQPLAHHPDEVIITGSAATVLVFSGHLWHSGRANDSSGRRRAVQMTTTVS